MFKLLILVPSKIIVTNSVYSYPMPLPRSRQSSLHLLSALVLSCALWPASVYAGEKDLFRYLDDEGQLVLNDTLPPSAAGRGYEVIRSDGTVLKTVKPAVASAEAAETQRQEQEAEKRRKWDESLLLRYSDVADIEDAKKRALGDIQIRISILRGNLNYLKTQVEREEFRAAEADRQGLEVSAEHSDAIRTLKWQIGDVEDLIAIRRRELEATEARYNRDMERFAAILNQIGSRR